MNDDKLFLIAIGGTGMRCLESFVHLCAAGLFDNRTIEILTLDTDNLNGNKDRVENLINLYNKVKTNDAQNEGGEARSETFFSAKLNLRSFYTDYSKPKRKTLQALMSTEGLTPQQRQNNEDLTDLFFDRDSVQQFPLDHGYRAQTHLGSLLMYHGIVEAARNATRGGANVLPQETELKEFIQLLNKNSSGARVFVFGSVFGGTGASSIPVIPRALADALKIITGGNNELNPQRVKFGTTLLTDYFSFSIPSEAQRKRDKVIADSNNFALNSQAALTFYNSDNTVRSTYKRLYHVGWPRSLKFDFPSGAGGDVITGGHDQCNPCHVAELMCAAAAFDFFTDPQLPSGMAEYVYRTVETTEDGRLSLSGASFAGDAKGDTFENKLGALFSLAHLILSYYEGAHTGICGTKAMLDDLERRDITDYSLPPDQAKQIDDYLKEFAYQLIQNTFIPGWIHQLKDSAMGGQLIFKPEAFSTDPYAVLRTDPGNIFVDEKHNWDMERALIPSKDAQKQKRRRIDKMVQILRSTDTVPKSGQGDTVKERFLAHIYNVITTAQKFASSNSENS